MAFADDERKAQRIELMMCLKPISSGGVYPRCFALLRTLLVLQFDVALQLKQHICRMLLTADDRRELQKRLADQNECMIAEFTETLAQCIEHRKMLEASYERFTEIRKSIDDKEADAELSEIEQGFRSRFDELDNTSNRLREKCSQLDQAKLKFFSEPSQTDFDFLQSAGTDRETLQLDQADLQAQIDSLRESMSKTLQSFLQDPDASLVELGNLPLPSIAIPEEAPEVDMSACIATQFNQVFGKEQFGFELHVAQEYVQFSHAIVNDLIYVLECRKPVDVTACVFDSERLRRTVSSVQRLLGTTLDRTDANEFGHLMQEVISDIVRLLRYDQEQFAKAAEFATSLSIDLDIIDRQISRSGQKGAGLDTVRLAQGNWDLLIELVAAGKQGTTGKQLAEKLNVTEGELIARKAALKNAIASLHLTIPDDEFCLETVAAPGKQLAWLGISIDEVSHQITRAGKKYQNVTAAFPNARTSEPWDFAKRLMEAGGQSVNFAKVFRDQRPESLRKIKERVSDELRKLDIAVRTSGSPSTWHAVDQSEKA